MMDIEDRIFQLTGQTVDGQEVMQAVVDEYGIDWSTAGRLYVKVVRERGTPQRVATKEAIARLGEIRFI